MISHETAPIKPEEKPGKATAKTLAACARIDQAERTRREQTLIDEWIRDRLVDGRDSCWRCRRPIVLGQLWTAVSNGEAVAPPSALSRRMAGPAASRRWVSTEIAI